jgi:hypothetical protein
LRFKNEKAMVCYFLIIEETARSIALFHIGGAPVGPKRIVGPLLQRGIMKKEFSFEGG